MTTKQRIEKNRILKEVTIDKLTYEVFGPIKHYSEYVDDLSTLGMFFLGRKTNIGKVDYILTKEDYDVVDKTLKEELLDFYKELTIEWDREEGYIEFYLQFNRYSKLIDKMSYLSIKLDDLKTID
jgi:hypothetical protein